MKKLNITPMFVDMTDPEKDTVRQLIDKNIEEKMSAYLEKVYATSPDVEVRCKATISKNKKRKFDGSFLLQASGMKPMVYIREDFDDLADLVNHAFDKFKM
jgi:hypothetical protein